MNYGFPLDTEYLISDRAVGLVTNPFIKQKIHCTLIFFPLFIVPFIPMNFFIPT